MKTVGVKTVGVKTVEVKIVRVINLGIKIVGVNGVGALWSPQVGKHSRFIRDSTIGIHINKVYMYICMTTQISVHMIIIEELWMTGDCIDFKTGFQSRMRNPPLGLPESQSKSSYRYYNLCPVICEPDT